MGLFNHRKGDFIQKKRFLLANVRLGRTPASAPFPSACLTVEQGGDELLPVFYFIEATIIKIL
jgi:hypothetical protein